MLLLQPFQLRHDDVTVTSSLHKVVIPKCPATAGAAAAALKCAAFMTVRKPANNADKSRNEPSYFTLQGRFSCLDKELAGKSACVNKKNRSALSLFVINPSGQKGAADLKRTCKRQCSLPCGRDSSTKYTR